MHGVFWLSSPGLPALSPHSLQVEDVCKTLAGFPQLKDGYNAVGFSQGKSSLPNPHAPIPQYSGTYRQSSRTYRRDPVSDSRPAVLKQHFS